MPLLVVMACSNSTPVGPPQWPFDPSGVWEGAAEGRLRGDQITSPLVLNLSDDRTCGFDTCLHGTWEWGGLTGELSGAWSASADSQECNPIPGVYCPFRVALDPPAPGACSQPPEFPGDFFGLIHLRAMFEGQATLVAPELIGTYWEGAFDDGWPCPSPELLSFDTELVLTRR